MKNYQIVKYVKLVSVIALSLALVGCPWLAPKDATVSILLASTEGGAKSLAAMLLGEKAVVNIDDIQSLTVTVTEVSLDSATTDEAPVPKLVVYQGEQDIELIDLTLSGLATLLSNDAVVSGSYTKIRLRITNPRLILKSAPDTVVTDIQLTANGRLFVSESFEIPEGQNSLILLDFGGLHLVQNGSDRYVLTPQLRADINVENADVNLAGVIQSVDTVADTLTLLVGDTEVTIRYGAATITLQTPGGPVAGTETDLVADANVVITGVITLDGSVDATAITVDQTT